MELRYLQEYSLPFPKQIVSVLPEAAFTDGAIAPAPRVETYYK